MPNGKASNPLRADEALAFVQDLMQRSQIPFIVLREAAMQLYLDQQPIVAEDITVCVLPQHAVDSCISTLESLLPPFVKDKCGYTFAYENEIACHIRLLKKKFQFLNDPEQRTFGWGWVFIPNPFNRYWKGRSFV